MQEIRAFIAHSFADDDQQLVQAFLDHFRTLENAYPNFSWDHAESAQPARLSQKVLEKIEGKNVFVGICTRKEAVLPTDGLKKTLLGNSVRIAMADVAYKTSDWLIQEVGLAVGRGMSIILFLENGVREPGGLYGDIEFIRFSREHPRESFDKLLQMLSSLTPKVGSVSVATEAKSAPEPQEKSSAVEIENVDPKPDWADEDYDQAAFLAIASDDRERLKKVDEAYRASKFANDDGVPLWEAAIEYFKLLFDKNGDLNRIKKLAEENKSSSRVIATLADAYGFINEYEEAGRTFVKAASVATEDKKVKNLIEGALAFQRGGDTTNALMLVEQAKTAAEVCSMQDDLLPDLRRFAEVEEKDEVLIALLEEIVAREPTDIDSRFSLAFKHSEAGNEDMSLNHYLRIPHAQRDPTSWNNLGVAYENFRMPVKSVAAYRLAAEQGNTLAMINLAFRYVQVGFIDEAQAECAKALKAPDPHKNIGQLMTRLADVPEEEDKKLKEIETRVKKKVAFYRKLGEAAAAPALALPSGSWQAPDGVLNATAKETVVRLSGKFKLPSNSLMALGTIGGAQDDYIMKVEFRVEFRGRMGFGSVKRERDGTKTILGEATPNEHEVVLYYEGAESLMVMERPNNPNPKFYTIRRQAGA